jgi:hypothetical protein
LYIVFSCSVEWAKKERKEEKAEKGMEMWRTWQKARENEGTRTKKRETKSDERMRGKQQIDTKKKRRKRGRKPAFFWVMHDWHTHVCNVVRMDMRHAEKDVEIAVGVMSALAVLLAAVEAWSWARR